MNAKIINILIYIYQFVLQRPSNPIKIMSFGKKSCQAAIIGICAKCQFHTHLMKGRKEVGEIELILANCSLHTAFNTIFIIFELTCCRIFSG